MRLAKHDPGSYSYSLATGIRFRAYGGDAVVFNPLSWETHLLNPAAALILQMASESPLMETTVRETLREVLGEAEQLKADEFAQRLLRELVDLGLLVKERAAFDETGCA